MDLDRVLPSPAPTPTDARAAARMDQVMNINDWYLFQASVVSSRSIGSLRRACWEYFAGYAITLLVAPQLDFLAQAPEWQVLTASPDNLIAWLDRRNARSSLKATTWERVAELARAA